jgi:hypothetical protein
MRSSVQLAAMFICGISVLCAQGYRREKPPDTAVVAHVGPGAITVREFLDNYEFGPAFVKRTANPMESHLQYMINENLIALDGYAHSVDTSVSLMRMMKEIEDDILVTSWYRHSLVPLAVVDSAMIESGVAQSAIDVDYRYLFTRNETRIREVRDEIDHGRSFDSLWASCRKDPEFTSQEESTNYFTLSQHKPRVAEAVARLTPGARSDIVRAGDGWFLVRLNHASKDMFMTSSRYAEMQSKVKEYYTKRILDSLTLVFLRKVLEDCPPTISGEALRKLFSAFPPAHEGTKLVIQHGGGLTELAGKDLTVLAEPGNDVMVSSGCDRFTMREFLAWYAYRNSGFDFSRANASSVARVREMLFTMVRDKRLIGIARDKGFGKDQEDLIELREWKDKLTYWKRRTGVLGNLAPSEDEVDQFYSANRQRYERDAQGIPLPLDRGKEKAKGDLIRSKFSLQMTSYLNALKRQYPITIDREILKRIRVSDEGLSKKIDVMVLKKGGTLPRQAFPTIDHEWELLQ